jgi:macrolide transport system ATP-binding/permease protein
VSVLTRSSPDERPGAVAKPLVEIRALTKFYEMGQATVHALNGIDLTIEKGEFVAVTGLSGSGKSTLMNLLGCLDTPSSGEYFFDGKPVSDLTKSGYAAIRNKRIGFVFQGFNLLARATALENVMLPLIYDRSGQIRDPRKMAIAALERVGLGDRMRHDPTQLSGGQQQRVAIARAIVDCPSIILADEPTGNLDTHTTVEIMALFRQLNKEGITVIFVTHDPDLAEYADRIVCLRDGAIEYDRPVRDRRSAEQELEKTGNQARIPISNDGRFGGLTRHSLLLKNLLNAAVRAIFKNKLRSLLTLVGIIIGVAGVIVMSAVGEGTQALLTQAIASLGNNVIIVFPGVSRSGGINQGAGTYNRVTLSDVEQLQKETKLLNAVSPIVRHGDQIVGGGKNWAAEICGVFPDYFRMKSWKAEYGSIFDKYDVNAKRKVALLGKTVADELFPDQDPTGKKVLIRNIPFTVQGVLKAKGQSGMGQDQDDIVLAPATTVLYRLKGGRYIDLINASVSSARDMDAAQEEIRAILRESHRLSKTDADDFTIQNQVQIIETVTKSTSSMTVFLSAVASISLIVGGIGIMNIMLVSVTERTREIGIRLAVGARNGDILTQFLAEAIVLSVTGGVLGILLALLTVYGVNEFTTYNALVKTQIILIAVGFSAAVGICFGFFPARKAASLSPIDALRYQ